MKPNRYAAAALTALALAGCDNGPPQAVTVQTVTIPDKAPLQTPSNLSQAPAGGYDLILSVGYRQSVVLPRKDLTGCFTTALAMTMTGSYGGKYDGGTMMCASQDSPGYSVEFQCLADQSYPDGQHCQIQKIIQAPAVRLGNQAQGSLNPKLNP